MFSCFTSIDWVLDVYMLDIVPALEQSVVKRSEVGVATKKDHIAIASVAAALKGCQQPLMAA